MPSKNPTIIPVYTFEVIGYNPEDLIGDSFPDTAENILLEFQKKTIWIKTIGVALNHGDQFVAFGQNALYLKKMYVDVDSPTLKIV